jgi:hypothetical protein
VRTCTANTNFFHYVFAGFQMVEGRRTGGVAVSGPNRGEPLTIAGFFLARNSDVEASAQR